MKYLLIKFSGFLGTIFGCVLGLLGGVFAIVYLFCVFLRRGFSGVREERKKILECIEKSKYEEG